MPNRWVLDNDGMVRWVADLSPALSRPAALLDWFATVLEAAETEEIWQVREAASLGYAFAEHGPLAPFLARQYAQTGVIDLGDFTYFGPNRYLTRLAYFDDQDQVVEALVDDLGRLMLQLHPPEAEKEFLGLCYPGLPALEIRGPLLDTRRPARSCNTLRGTEIRVYFQLYSDIWFPWVPGMIDEAYDLNKRFDNRALARVHTPRLNRVLAVARAATERLGGRWFLDRDPDNLRRDRAFMLSDAGVLVEADLPPEYRLNTGQKRRWEDDMAVHKAALAAVRAVRENPAAPRPELVFPADHPPGSGLARALDTYQIPWRVAAEE